MPSLERQSHLPGRSPMDGCLPTATCTGVASVPCARHVRDGRVAGLRRDVPSGGSVTESVRERVCRACGFATGVGEASPRSARRRRMAALPRGEARQSGTVRATALRGRIQARNTDGLAVGVLVQSRRHGACSIADPRDPRDGVLRHASICRGLHGVLIAPGFLRCEQPVIVSSRKEE